MRGADFDYRGSRNFLLPATTSTQPCFWKIGLSCIPFASVGMPLNYFPKPYTARNGHAGFGWRLFCSFLVSLGPTQPRRPHVPRPMAGTTFASRTPRKSLPSFHNWAPWQPDNPPMLCGLTRGKRGFKRSSCPLPNSAENSD